MKCLWTGLVAVVLVIAAAGCKERPSPVGAIEAPPRGAPRAAPSATPGGLAGGESSVLAASTDGDALPTLSATIWKREVVSQEPILLKLEVTNPGTEEVTIVAPYLNSYGRANYPLALVVTDVGGARVRDGWEYGETGYEVILRGAPWWTPGQDRLQPGDTEFRAWRAWRIPAGETAYMWYNMLQFYPLDDPGQYHIVLKYDSKPEMLFEPGQKKDNPPKDVLCWSAEIDAGWVTVKQPGPGDAAACEMLRKHPQVQGVVFATNFALTTGDNVGDDAGLLSREGSDWSWIEGTTYEPYARFGWAFYRSESPSPRDAAGLPLGDLLRTVGPRYLAGKRGYNPGDIYRRPLDQVPWKSALERERAYEELREKARRSVEAYETAVQVAREVGDYSILGYIEKPAAVNLYAVKLHFPDWPN